MEITCTRCHQAVEAGTCYCPACGMPQLVYSTEGSGEQGLAERGEMPVRDAASVDWKQAMRVAIALAVPAGILCSMYSPFSTIGIFLMAGTAAWVVAIYLRKERPAWITIGAGARIGLVTGILGGWTTFAASGVTLSARRFLFHQGNTFDALWQNIEEQLSQRETMSFNAQSVEIIKAWLHSPAGRAGWVVASLAMVSGTLMLFAVAGGALSARLLGRPGRQQL
ncbi:MAG TPA: hypothetical protein VGR47_19975 [Terracidiphilus sp.]|nr:hypothetical protein [Terracidiphilus sp.]